ETGRTLGADTVGACLADPGGEALRPVAGFHVPRDLIADSPDFAVPLRGHRLFEEAWASGQPAAAARAASDPRGSAALLARYPARSLVFVPMIIRDRPIGGLIAFWWQDERTLSPEDLRLLAGIGRQAGLAVENARLFAARQEETEVSRALLALADAVGG